MNSAPHRADCVPCAAQANDFERYKELMAQEQDAAANEKLEVIERFLRDTEEYLTRLTEKIASVQVNQEASAAAATATADARAQARIYIELEFTDDAFLQHSPDFNAVSCCCLWVPHGILSIRFVVAFARPDPEMEPFRI